MLFTSTIVSSAILEIRKLKIQLLRKSFALFQCKREERKNNRSIIRLLFDEVELVYCRSIISLQEYEKSKENKEISVNIITSQL
jgi:hypothetical protein